MGHISRVTGYIVAWDDKYMEQNMEAIAKFPFDRHCFTNIFWGDSPDRYFMPLIGFVGSYRQIEEMWSEWLWKFSQMLSTLEAVKAKVNLECIIGDYTWVLRPKTFCSSPGILPKTLIGQEWVIIEAPEEDFSIDPGWLQTCEKNLQLLDSVTGTWKNYHWDKFVERWLRQ